MDRISEIKKEKRKLMRYMERSQRSIQRNLKKMRTLEREQEILLNPSLPGIGD